MVVFAAGALALVSTFAGSDHTSDKPDKGFRPTLLKAAIPLKNSQGVTIKTFWQIDPAIRQTIREFLVTGVARKDQGKAWETVAPSVRQGYTHRSWTRANALPIIFYPVADVNHVQYYLDYASNEEILVEVGLFAPKRYGMRATSFQLGLVPVGKKWLVDYFMPRWTPQLPNEG